MAAPALPRFEVRVCMARPALPARLCELWTLLLCAAVSAGASTTGECGPGLWTATGGVGFGGDDGGGWQGHGPSWQGPGGWGSVVVTRSALRWSALQCPMPTGQPSPPMLCLPDPAGFEGPGCRGFPRRLGRGVGRRRLAISLPLSTREEPRRLEAGERGLKGTEFCRNYPYKWFCL